MCTFCDKIAKNHNNSQHSTVYDKHTTDSLAFITSSTRREQSKTKATRLMGPQ